MSRGTTNVSRVTFVGGFHLVLESEATMMHARGWWGGKEEKNRYFQKNKGPSPVQSSNTRLNRVAEFQVP